MAKALQGRDAKRRKQIADTAQQGSGGGPAASTTSAASASASEESSEPASAASAASAATSEDGDDGSPQCGKWRSGGAMVRLHTSNNCSPVLCLCLTIPMVVVFGG